MESTPPGDTALTIDQAAQAFKGLLGAKAPPPETREANETKEPETQVESTDEPTPEVKADDPGEETKAEGEEKAESSTEAKDTKTDADEAFFETLDELAEAAGIPLEKLLSLKTRTKVGELEDSVPLSQIVKSYQLEGHLTRKSQELSEKLKTAEIEREKLNNDLNFRLQEANTLIGHFEQQFMSEYNAVNWQELRQNDPAEFAAKKQEYNDRYGQLMNYRQQVQANAVKLQNETQEKTKVKFQEILKTEEEHLLSKFQEWKDPEKYTKGKKELIDYLRSAYAFNDDEVSQIYDHRHVEIIHKAMLYDKQSTKSEVAKKKVVTLPKLLKPSSQPSQAQAQKARIAEQLKRLDKTGKVEDAASVFKAMLKK